MTGPTHPGAIVVPGAGPPDPAGGEAVEVPGADRVVGAWRELASMAPEEERAPILQALARVERRLRSPRFRVAFVGGVGSGKTALLNLMVGGEAVPSLIRPRTARVVVAWGERPGARLEFLSGAGSARLDDWPEPVVRHVRGAGLGPIEPIDLPHDGLASILEAGLDPREADPVIERCLVSWPSDFLGDGVEFLDTPPVPHDDSTADAWHEAVDDADLVVFVADLPLARGGWRHSLFAREFQGRGHDRVAIVLTSPFLRPSRAGRRHGDELDRALADAASWPGGHREAVFSLSLSGDDSPSGGEMDRLREALRRASTARSSLKQRSALLRLGASLEAAFAGRPSPERAEFSDRVASMIRDLPEASLIGNGVN